MDKTFRARATVEEGCEETLLAAFCRCFDGRLRIALQRRQDALKDAGGLDWVSSKPVLRAMARADESNHLDALRPPRARDLLAFDRFRYDQVLRTTHH